MGKHVGYLINPDPIFLDPAGASYIIAWPHAKKSLARDSTL